MKIDEPKWMINILPCNLPTPENMTFWQKYDWKQIILLSFLPIISALLIWFHYHYETFRFELLLYLLLFTLFGAISVVAGYHRLYSHNSYQASMFLKIFYLFWGPSALQNSALKWANDHRRHHRYSEKKEDPYPVYRGFFYAHWGWAMCSEKKRYRTNMVSDLLADSAVIWQHKNYSLLAIFHSIALPLFIGYLYSSPVGGLVFIGCIKVFILQNLTSCINSFCHLFGSRNHDQNSSARDHLLNALLTFGEGYHNYHHAYPKDYRAGHLWYHWDPAKWFIWSMFQLRLATNLTKNNKNNS